MYICNRRQFCCKSVFARIAAAANRKICKKMENKADSVDSRDCPQMAADIDGLRYSPDDLHYGLGPVHTNGRGWRLVELTNGC